MYLKRNVYWPDIPEYIELAINTTRLYDPNVLLGYNEYKCESATGWQQVKSDELYKLMSKLKRYGSPIDYIGLQNHINLGYMNYTNYLEGVKNNTQRLADLGLQIHFTEVTVACVSECEDSWDESMDEAQVCGLVLGNFNAKLPTVLK